MPTMVNFFAGLMACLESNLYLPFHLTAQYKILLRDLALTLQDCKRAMWLNHPATTLADGIIQFSNCSLAKFTEVTLKVVHETIKKSPLKSCPSDPIPTQTLMSCFDELLLVITTLVNSSLRASIFPNAFKEGRLLPKIKKASLDKEDLNNFRPVMILAFAWNVI